jgi:outer membrane protein assembly factor BamB
MQVQRGGILLGTLLILLVPGHDLRELRHGVEVLWRFDTGGCLEHAPAAAEGMVYVVSGNGALDQIDGLTGRLRRTIVATRRPRRCQFRGPLMLTSRLVVAGFGTGSLGQAQVRAFDRLTGQQRWSQTAGQGLAPSMSRLGRRLFVPTTDGQVECLDVDTGERHWSVPIPVGDRGSLAVSVNRVFAGTSDGSLYSLNAATGDPEWRTELGAPITTTVRRSERALFAGTLDGRVHRVDIKTGQILASRRLGAKLVPRSAPVIDRDGRREGRGKSLERRATRGSAGDGSSSEEAAAGTRPRDADAKPSVGVRRPRRWSEQPRAWSGYMRHGVSLKPLETSVSSSS